MKIIKTADNINTLISERYNQTYHSKHGVLQEANHVFLQGSGVSELLKINRRLRILEIGFGIGFNFFLTAKSALINECELEYFAIENDLPDYKMLIELRYENLFSDNEFYQNFMTWRKITSAKKGVYQLHSENIQLFLILQNALDYSYPANFFDAVYHDAFSPLQNPELWTKDFFKKIYHCMKQDSKLSTYSAKGDVRRALLAAGFNVEKKAGPVGKREILVATKIL
jgi:tRNA U34 5-methylaminomethyl-2-thiouridine-forming methyltransferase MnmC